jgi:hypothetical protein
MRGECRRPGDRVRSSFRSGTSRRLMPVTGFRKFETHGFGHSGWARSCTRREQALKPRDALAF